MYLSHKQISTSQRRDISTSTVVCFATQNNKDSLHQTHSTRNHHTQVINALINCPHSSDQLSRTTRCKLWLILRPSIIMTASIMDWTGWEVQSRWAWIRLNSCISAHSSHNSPFIHSPIYASPSTSQTIWPVCSFNSCTLGTMGSSTPAIITVISSSQEILQICGGHVIVWYQPVLISLVAILINAV